MLYHNDSSLISSVKMRKIFNKVLIIYCVCAFGSVVLVIKYSDYFHSQLQQPQSDPTGPIILYLRYGKNIPGTDTIVLVGGHDQTGDKNVKKVISAPNEDKVADSKKSQVTAEEMARTRTTTTIRSSSSRVVEKNDGYDSKVQDEFRLGFRLNPESVLTLPKSWQETLREQVEVLTEGISENDSKVEKEDVKNRTNINNTNNVKLKKILLYDSYEWWNFDGDLKCPLLSPDYKCEYKDRDNNMIESNDFGDLDAVVLVRDFQHTDDPFTVMGSSIYQGNNKKNNKSVSRIFFTLESPLVTNFRVSMKDPRDYLASYWRGSDIYAPYFKWHYYDPKTTRKTQTVDYAMGKTKMAAIVVSNCIASNYRLDLVHQLQKYVQVDVYGGCGDHDCQEKEDRSSCFKDIKNDYKFYLSFENANCRDYITEKLHQNAYENDLVPIVFGAHPNDYSSLAPSHSYIHVEDFDSMKDLANYLQLLNSNDTLYNEYFEYKSTGEFIPSPFMCELCAMLHVEGTPEFKSSRGNTHNDRSFEIESLEDLTYLNNKDSYDFKDFYWGPQNELMCNGKTYWNR